MAAAMIGTQQPAGVGSRQIPVTEMVRPAGSKFIRQIRGVEKK